MPDPSHVCYLHHSSWQGWILNPLSEARDPTCVFMDTRQIRFHWATVGTLSCSFWMAWFCLTTCLVFFHKKHLLFLDFWPRLQHMNNPCHSSDLSCCSEILNLLYQEGTPRNLSLVIQWIKHCSEEVPVVALQKWIQLMAWELPYASGAKSKTKAKTKNQNCSEIILGVIPFWGSNMC